MRRGSKARQKSLSDEMIAVNELMFGGFLKGNSRFEGNILKENLR